MKTQHFVILTLLTLLVLSCTRDERPVATTNQGQVRGLSLGDVHAYLGVPYAQPPVGQLRWREPLPPMSYDTVLDASHFRADPMQPHMYDDMIFHGPCFSEDCLYLNIWAPVPDKNAPQTVYPVLMYFNGGGWMAGSGSEPRYDGAALARKGVIVVTANYREGIFGFFAHPELTARSGVHSSGNQGLLDQAAAIQWVHDNIRAFGGDSTRITIAGESAGAFSVSTLLCSPLVKDLLFGAIGSSGAEVAPYTTRSLDEAEQEGVHLIEYKGLTIDQLLSLPPAAVQEQLPPSGMKAAVVDGYLLTESTDETYAAGRQAEVPLLIGWNSKEASPLWYLQEPYSLADCRRMLLPRLKEHTDEVLEAYGIKTDADVLSQGAVDLVSDLFTALVSWRWSELHRRSGRPVYRYLFMPARPGETDGKTPDGAVHSADIEYAMNNLYLNKVFRWRDEDYELAEFFSSCYARFCQTGNPIPETNSWPQLDEKGETLFFDFHPYTAPLPDTERRKLLERILVP